MVKESMDKETYAVTEANTFKDLKNLKQFLKQIFKGYDQLDEMLHISNQPEYASAKTYNFMY